MHVSKNNNTDLMLLGGVAAIAAVVLMNRNAEQTGGGGGGSTSSPLFGTDSSGNPTIFQLPSETFTGFPQGDDSGLAQLLAMLGAPSSQQVKGDTVTKKESYLDAGQVYQGTVLPKPFISSTPQSKKEAAVSQVATASLDYVMPGAGYMAPGYTDLLGGFAGLLSGILPGGFGGQTAPAAAGPALNRGADRTVLDFAGASATASVQSKKEATVSGFSGQTINDNGVLYWNPNAGFGLSTDPSTGQVVPYQRDINIYDYSSGLVYSPDMTSKKEAFSQLTYDNRRSGVQEGYALNSYELLKVATQANSNYSPGTWVDGVGLSKKESTIANYAVDSGASALTGGDLYSTDHGDYSSPPTW